MNDNNLECRPSKRRWWVFLILAMVFSILTIISFPFDNYLSEHFQLEKLSSLSGDLTRIITLSEVFAHGSTVFLLLFTLYWIDLPSRNEIALAAWMTILGGVSANISKSIFTRIRPHAMESIQAGQNDGGWMPLFSGSFWEATHRSFPSGHAATAVALACGLSIAYPRGRWLFCTYATLACLQRIACGAHFPSDTLAGAAIGCLAAALLSIRSRR